MNGEAWQRTDGLAPGAGRTRDGGLREHLPHSGNWAYRMAVDSHSQLASFIWSICNLLSGPYKRNEYRKVILRVTVLQRFDCLLEPTKTQVLAEPPNIKAKPETVVRSLLEKITGRPFYHLSKSGYMLANPPFGVEWDQQQRRIEREVETFGYDAWIDQSKTRVGYPIPLNRHSYQYEPPRPLDVIEADIKSLEREIFDLLGQFTGNSGVSS